MQGRILRTDLACERCKASSPSQKTEYKEERIGSIEKSTLDIKDECASKENCIPIGSYTTLYFPALQDAEDEVLSELTHVLSEVIKEYLIKALRDKEIRDACILVAGLGNRFMTSDSIGPHVIDKVLATNHIAKQDKKTFTRYFHARTVTLATGVMSQTGIESAELVSAACKQISPDAVIVIDALASRSCQRLASTIQITDAGISPGSGIGNTRSAINKEVVGCPTIAIGVPTVVESSTLVYDALEQAGFDDIPSKLLEVIREDSFFVSPKDSDLVAENASRVISDALNMVLNESVYE